GELNCSVVWRALYCNRLNALNTSARSCSSRPPPSRMLRWMARSMFRVPHATNRFEPDSSAVLPGCGPVNATDCTGNEVFDPPGRILLLNCEYGSDVHPLPI